MSLKKPSKYSPRARTKGKRGIRGRFPSLNPTKNLRIRQEMLEGLEYTQQLPIKERGWYDKFMEGYNNGAVKKNKYNSIHKLSKDKSICFSINNSRNKDSYALAKARNLLVYGSTLDYFVHQDEITNGNSHEDTAIELMDMQRGREKFCACSEAFILEVKSLQKSLPKLMKELRAATSMARVMQLGVKDGELAPSGTLQLFEGAVESLTTWQSDQTDVVFDNNALGEELVKHTELLSYEKHKKLKPSS